MTRPPLIEQSGLRVIFPRYSTLLDLQTFSRFFRRLFMQSAEARLHAAFRRSFADYVLGLWRCRFPWIMGQPGQQISFIVSNRGTISVPPSTRAAAKSSHHIPRDGLKSENRILSEYHSHLGLVCSWRTTGTCTHPAISR